MRGRNHPAISSQQSSRGSTYLHPARSIRSLRNNPQGAATNSRLLALCTRVAKKLPCLPNLSMFAPAPHRLAKPSPPYPRATLPASSRHCVPPESRRNIASTLHKPITTHHASVPDNFAWQAQLDGDICHSTNEKIRVAANPSAFRRGP